VVGPSTARASVARPASRTRVADPAQADRADRTSSIKKPDPAAAKKPQAAL
jgi:hypothetical protein